MCNYLCFFSGFATDKQFPVRSFEKVASAVDQCKLALWTLVYDWGRISDWFFDLCMTLTYYTLYYTYDPCLALLICLLVGFWPLPPLRLWFLPNPFRSVHPSASLVFDRILHPDCDFVLPLWSLHSDACKVDWFHHSSGTLFVILLFCFSFIFFKVILGGDLISVVSRL